MSYNDKGIFISRAQERLYYESRSQEKRDNYQSHFIYVHGALSHAMGQSRFLDDLVERYSDSIISYFDFSGHGKSSGNKAYVKSLDDYSEQLAEFIEFQKKSNPAKRIVLIGYSMGGLVSLTLLNKQNKYFDLLVLVNPCLKLNDDRLAKVVRRIKTVSSNTLGRVRLPVLAPASSLTNDEVVIKEIENDSLRASHITVSLLSELHRVAAKVRLHSINDHPAILFLISGADVTVQPEITRIYAQGFKTSLCEVKYYKYAKHDLLNEVHRQDVYNDINNWLNLS